jgi:hypothetical protein
MEPSMNRAAEEAWRQLRFGWDTAYTFSFDPGRPEPFQAVRKDGLGTLSAADPEALDELVVRDYTARRVPREIAP